MKKIPITVLGFAMQKMGDAFNVLPRSEANVARFYYVYFLTLKEISKKSRKSESWAYQKLNRARRRLKSMVGQVFIDYFEAHCKILKMILKEVEREAKEGRGTLRRLI